MNAVNTSPFNVSMLRKFNVWYSVKDGSWSDPAVWISNGSKKHSLPQPGDDVYVNHTVDYSNSLNGTYLFNNTIRNLFVNGRFVTLTGGNQNKLVITGSVICSGTLDFSNNIGIILDIRGVYNIINNYLRGNGETIMFNTVNACNIPAVNYNNLQISNTGVKYVTGDLNVNTLTTDATSTIDLGPYNATIGTCSLQGLVTKTSSLGTVSFAGQITIINSTGAINFTTYSPTVNVSGGVTTSSGDLRGGFNFGSGTVNVLTTQTWTMNNSGNQPTAPVTNGNILIASGKTLSIDGPGGININGMSTINGADAASKLNILSTFAYGNTNTPMATGVFNYNYSGTSRIMIMPGVTMTFPFTSFYDLTILGTATASGNITVSDILFLSGGSLQLGSYDLTATAQTTQLQGPLQKSGGGTVSLGAIAYNGNGAILFTGNPIVNLSGNITGDARNGMNFGTGVVNILANMSFSINGSANVEIPMFTNIVIASGKTMTNLGLGTSSGGLSTTGSLTGADSTAIFDNRSIFKYANAANLMSTGQLQANNTLNTIEYKYNGNQNITAVNYRNLTLSTGGVKTLLGNVSVINAYTLSTPAVLNSNGFALTNP